MSNASAPSNKYTSLISNTVIFGISTFGSKVLSIVLTRLYTELLEASDFGTYNLIIITCNFILPVMYLCIAESVIRFGMEKDYRRSDVFSVGVITVLAGWGILWCFYPLLGLYENLAAYRWLIYLFCLTSAMRTVVTSYVRATGLVRVFAIDGVVTTATNFAFTLFFLLGTDLGIVGLVLAVILSDGLSSLSLFLLLRLHRFFKLRGIDHHTIYDMVRYAVPLVPNAVAWTVTNLSDQFFITEMLGSTQSGLYAAAIKLPTILQLVSTFFTRAWELSAFSEYKTKEGQKFFSNVFRSYYTLVFLGASGLVLLLRPLSRLFISSTYYGAGAWRYSPFLILAVAFQCLVTFLGAVYNAERKNVMVTVTTIVGAVLNIILNWTLIPVYGPSGAAFATFASFLVVFVIRAVDTRRYIRIDMQPLRIAMSLVFLLAQVWVALSETRLRVLWSVLLFFAMAVCNAGYLIFLARRLLQILRARRNRA